MDDWVSKTCGSKPTRLYFVGIEGQIIYAGGVSPYGFNPSAHKTAIDAYLLDVDQPECSTDN